MSLLPVPSGPKISFPINENRNPAVLSLMFGDSYTQECQDGISGEKTTDVSVTWTKLTRFEKDVIDAFLDERGGVERFYYTMPGASAYHVYTCAEWELTEINFNNWTITAKWKRTPNTDAG